MIFKESVWREMCREIYYAPAQAYSHLIKAYRQGFSRYRKYKNSLIPEPEYTLMIASAVCVYMCVHYYYNTIKSLCVLCWKINNKKQNLDSANSICERACVCYLRQSYRTIEQPDRILIQVLRCTSPGLSFILSALIYSLYALTA